MIRLKRFTTHILIPLAPSLFLGACGAVRQAVPEAESSTTVTGNAMLGPVDGATVTAYALAEDGSLDTSVVLGTATTDSNGEYTLTIPNSALPVDAPIGLEMNGGTYTEESSGDTVDLSGKSYTTLLASVDKSSSVNAAVGPLPDMAFKKFKAQMDAGLPPDSTMKKLVTDSNYQVSQAFGISDVVGVLPANTYGTIPDDTRGQYALVMAAISKAAHTAGTDSTAMADAYGKSLLDHGDFSAVGSGSVDVKDATGHAVSFTPPSLSNLATTVTQIGAGSITLPGVKPPETFSPPNFKEAPPTTAPPAYVPGTPPKLPPIEKPNVPSTPAAPGTSTNVPHH